MHYLTVEDLSKSYGIQPLFNNITFHISEGDKVALIARNGTGKSTLLRIITQKEHADGGKVWLHKEVTAAYLEQDTPFEETQTAAENIFSHPHPIIQALKKYNSLMERSYDDLELQEAAAVIDNLQAWSAESEIQTIISQLKINFLNQPMKSLSGGQRKRIALAKTLIDASFDHQHCLLILDEPTNHLDFDMIEWLENYLSDRTKTILLVTHDRYFMDNVCNNILEIENGKLFSYKGDFAYYIQKKSEREIADASEQEKNKNIYRRELEWIRKQPKARTTKSKSRVDAFDDVEAKALARKDNLQMELNMKMNRLGGKVIEMKKVYKQFGDKPILKGFDYTFKRKERIGIVGPNGTGKTTFLNIVAGLEKEDSGKVNIGETVVFGYFNQQGLQFKEDMRTIEYVKDIAENFVLADGTKVSASQFMLLFLFDADKQYTYLSKLSGGEKRRLQLMAILYRNPNFLILDEPTNDLDLITLQVLENFLLHFEGCVLIVSHDRYFMDKLVDHLFVFEGEAIINDYPGNFTEYRAYQKAVSRNKNKDKEKEPELISLSDLTPAVKEKVKMNYNDKKEYEKLEREMAKLEEEKIKLSESLIGQTDFESIQKISDQLTAVVKSLEEKGNRWLEIAMQYE